MWSSRLVALLMISSAACSDAVTEDEPGDGIDDTFLSDGRADSFGVPDGTPTACAALLAANELGKSTLDIDAGLSSRAAASIVELRPFDTLAELDAAPYVGPATFEALVTYAVREGLTCPTQPPSDLLWRTRVLHHLQHDDEVPPAKTLVYTTFRAAGPAQIAVHGVGTGTQAVARVYGPIVGQTLPDDALAVGVKDGGVDAMLTFDAPRDGVYAITVEEANGRQGFVWIRPTDVPAVTCESDADCATGSVCLDRIEALAHTEVCGPPPVVRGETCTEPGGTYVSTVFTQQEACDALTYLNEASWLDMRALGDGMRPSAHNVRYGERHEWVSLAQFLRKRFEYGGWTSSMVRRLRTASRGYAPADSTADTVANVFEARNANSGREVVLADALVTKTVSVPGYSCAEVRDTERASEFLQVCHPCLDGQSCDYDEPTPDLGPVCDEARCGVGVASRVGERVWARGTLTYLNRRWTVVGDPGVGVFPAQ